MTEEHYQELMACLREPAFHRFILDPAPSFTKVYTHWTCEQTVLYFDYEHIDSAGKKKYDTCDSYGVAPTYDECVPLLKQKLETIERLDRNMGGSYFVPVWIRGVGAIRHDPAKIWLNGKWYDAVQLEHLLLQMEELLKDGNK